MNISFQNTVNELANISTMKHKSKAQDENFLLLFIPKIL